jgi:hypothetical protein
MKKISPAETFDRRQPRGSVAESIAQALAQLDRTGKSIAEIQIDAARYLESVALEERKREAPDIDKIARFLMLAAKVAHDVSPYLYPTHQSIKHGGDEDARPIRIESLSDYQLDMLIQRLQRGG